MLYCLLQQRLLRRRTIDLIRNSKVYASTFSFESAGISTFEAFSFGLPAILWKPGKYEHASTEYEDGRWCYHNDPSLISKIQDFDAQTRTQAAMNFRLNYSTKNVYKALKDVFETYLGIRRMSEQSNLERFYEIQAP